MNHFVITGKKEPTFKSGQNIETPFCDMNTHKPFTSWFGQSTEVSVQFDIFREKVLQMEA